MIDILVVDDHPLFRDGFAHSIRVLRPQWEVRFTDTAANTLRSLADRVPDVIIADVMLPDGDGFALLDTVAGLSPTTPRIVISGRDDAAVRMRARACGARAFLAKTTGPEAIAAAIDTVLAGGTAFDDRDVSQSIPTLTARQSEILMLLAAGLSNKEIRHRLNIAERTVRAHLTELFTLLQASSRMQAVVRARQLGLIA